MIDINNRKLTGSSQSKIGAFLSIARAIETRCFSEKCKSMNVVDTRVCLIIT